MRKRIDFMLDEDPLYVDTIFLLVRYKYDLVPVGSIRKFHIEDMPGQVTY